MSVYPNREEIQEWVGWARRYLPSEGDIPPIDWSGPEVHAEPGTDTPPSGEGTVKNEPPWTGWCQEILDEVALGTSQDEIEGMLDGFAAAMCDPRDLPARFTALHFYFSLASEDWSDFSIYNQDLCESAHATFRRNLTTLVGMLPVEECPHDWRRLKWEISCSMAAEDWDRARQLYALAEALGSLDARDLWVLRGQFKFFRALGRDKESRRDNYCWLLIMNPPDSELGSLFASRAYWFALIEAPKKVQSGGLSEKAQGWVVDARNDLEKAFQSRADLNPVYHLMLGTCYSALSDYPRATAEYKLVLDLERKFKRINFDVFAHLFKNVRPAAGESAVDVIARAIEGNPTGLVWDYKPKLFAQLGDSCKRGGKPAEAEAVYNRWAQEYPKDPAVYRGLADLLEQETKYQEAYEALRKEIELRPEAEQEPGYRIALALGAIAGERLDLDKEARQVFDRHPEVMKLLDLLFLDLWPGYSKVGEQARAALLHAAYLTYCIPAIDPDVAGQFVQTGAEKFAKALEIEMRERIFVRFRDTISRDNKFLEAVERLRTDKMAGTFATFLLAKGELGLGQMEFILRRARSGENQLFARFGEWVRENFPRLTPMTLDVLKKVCRPRNLEAHRQLSLDVKDVPKFCREILDALLPGSTSGPVGRSG